MKLTDSILNVGSTNLSALITSTPIGLIADQLQESDKYTPPTIKPPDYIPSLRNPPLAPKRQNTRNVYADDRCFSSSTHLLFSSYRQQYGFDDTTASASTATLLQQHELASTSLTDTRKTIGTRKVSHDSFISYSRTRSREKKMLAIFGSISAGDAHWTLAFFLRRHVVL